MRVTSSMISRNYSRINSLAYAKSRQAISPAIARGRQTGSSRLALSRYAGQEENAESLRSSAGILGWAGRNGIFDNARDTGSNKAILYYAKQLVNGYNSTLSGTKNDNSPLNRVYRQLLENTATDNKESLSKVGITVNRDKSLSIDEAKMKSASIDELEAALGSKSAFTSRVESTAENISRNSASSARSLGRAYNAYSGLLAYHSYTGMGTGSLGYLPALLSGANKYNFWG